MSHSFGQPWTGYGRRDCQAAATSKIVMFNCGQIVPLMIHAVFLGALFPSRQVTLALHVLLAQLGGPAPLNGVCVLLLVWGV